ncbi:PKD domain-containing protein [Filimonas effusa]|uniref:T9SS type B sorting domain-containing protein n=1 Tax=Filimonas effusa TaxID=2508721 RepID=A0A4Q1D3E6_9BACT|nr:PKD domain-containing protein [Filimonas effusa]RXK82818.1 T9SS type B sorting domain-containing protein [Filimonas effusa]
MWHLVITHIKTIVPVTILLFLQQEWCFAQSLSNEGKEFWVAYAPHRLMGSGAGNAQEMYLCFSAATNAHIRVTISGTAYLEEYDVAANTIATSKPIPKGIPAAAYDARLFKTGNVEDVYRQHAIHIETNVPVVAYARIAAPDGAATALLLPADTWGYAYVSLNSKQSCARTRGGNKDCFSFMYIIAANNNTRLNITPSANTRGGRKAGTAFTLTLQKGEVFLMAGEAVDDENGADLSGTRVTSVANDQGNCYPVAVFSGSSYTQVACTGTDGSAQNLLQQAVPLPAWGTEFMTSPTSVDDNPAQHNINIYRILVSDPATIVKKNGQRLWGLNGSYYEYQSNTADFIEADKPIFVAQYMPSANACSYTGTGNPSMIYLSATSQAVRRTQCFRDNSNSVKATYLLLIIPSKGLAQLKIDGKPDNYDNAYAHPNKAGYTVVVKRWSAGGAQQCVIDSDDAFTAITCGMGAGLSYGFNAGVLLSAKSGLASIQNKYAATTGSQEFTCVNTPVALSVLLRYQPERLEWRFSELPAVVTPAANVTTLQPVSTGTEIIDGITYYRYSLPGYYAFKTEGMYDLPLYATGLSVTNCSHTERIPYNIQVKATHVIAYDVSYKGCRKTEDVVFNAAASFEGGEDISTWQWYFPDDSIAKTKTTSYSLQPGPHTMRLLAADAQGCVADTTFGFNIPAAPIALFSADAASVCQDAPLQFTGETPAGTSEVIKEWRWDFGDGSGATTRNPVKQFARPGNYTVNLTVTSGQGCASLPATASYTVHALPLIDAGADLNALKDSQVTLKASAMNAAQLTFSWQPAALLNSPDVLNPSYRVTHDQRFLLKASGGPGNCTATDSVKVTMLLPVEVPNSFSPNGDGIHDRWFIPQLAAYEGASVIVVNRYGQQVFHAAGYTTPWDGTSEGKPLAAGTYYYIIRLPVKKETITGTLTILR